MRKPVTLNRLFILIQLVLVSNLLSSAIYNQCPADQTDFLDELLGQTKFDSSEQNKYVQQQQLPE